MIPRVMQPHAEKVGDRYRFVGPCIDPRREDPADWTPPPGDGPLALLAFGTYYTNRIDVYRNTIEALDGADWRLVIATGRVKVEEAVPSRSGSSCSRRSRSLRPHGGTPTGLFAPPQRDS